MLRNPINLETGVRVKRIIEIPEFELSNGVKIPALGMGTFPIGNKRIPMVMREAKRIGYTLFDTSTSYGNELGVGLSLGKHDFITTKISNCDQKNDSVRLGFRKSRLKLHRRQIDLLLLHWPYPGRFAESWKVLEELYERGACRAIGVANFKIHHLEELMETAEIAPMVNQFERHPMHADNELVEYCRAHDITPEAYTPFARMDERLFGDSRLSDIARHHEKKATQIILRWNYQNGVISIPKTESPSRMLENASIFDFELSDNEMSVIDSMDCGMRVRHDSDNCDFDKL